MECKFYVGQKVVAVEPVERDHPANIHLSPYVNQIPIKGQVYTIRMVYIDDGMHKPAVLLNELVNRIYPKAGHEVGFSASIFRPATDISIFTAMLKRTTMPKELENA
jgi:hypothetical protein